MIGEDMLKGRMRNFIIKHKGFFMNQVIKFAKTLPDPIIENTNRHNTHILIGIKDKFFKLENNAGRKELFEAAWKILITEYEHDPYYSYRIDWVLDEIQKSDWKEKPCWQPTRDNWNEPLPEGITQTRMKLPQHIVEKLREMGGVEGIPTKIIMRK